ncbi:MAG TPA: YidC/Oxa1 family membrane protein insertase [Actinomycetota bacterium]|nr:YidC/Oxa1 family membrane protein insertase [Actinomycetota bacterium]
MLAEIGPFQALLDAIGWVLASLYDLVGNFGIAIIILTIVFRVVLLPLGIKQIKSMQATQALQPKVKEIQRKYKGNKQKIQEQTMKLYQEYGVNPLGGCLPLLLQFPILIAMYAVIRAPVPYAENDPAKPANVDCAAQADEPLPAACFKDNHLPEDSELFIDMTEQNEEGMTFLLMNLQCSPQNAGKTVDVVNTEGNPSGHTLSCGDSWPDRIPYYVLLALMIATTFYSSRQTQKATPASAQNPQTQVITKVMPLMFGVFGFAFPSGLVLYWSMSNLFQIGQQAVMLRLGHIGPEAMDRRLAQTKAKAAAKGDKPRSGFMGQLMSRADQERNRRTQDAATLRKPPPRGSAKGGAKGGTGTSKGTSASKGATRKGKGRSGRPKGSGPNRPKPPRR